MGLMHCMQKPGEVMFVPRRWHHATLNVGTALGLGGQVVDSGRSLADIDKDISAWPNAAGFHLERTGYVSDPVSEIRQALKLEPHSLRTCAVLIATLARQSNIDA